MGHIKNEVERLRKAEQEGSGWLQRKVGEIQLVRDALPPETLPAIDEIAVELEQPPHERRFTTKDTQLVHQLHRDFALDAINASVRYETTQERAEQAKERAAKGGAVSPEATQEPKKARRKARNSNR